MAVIAIIQQINPDPFECDKLPHQRHDMPEMCESSCKTLHPICVSVGPQMYKAPHTH